VLRTDRIKALAHPEVAAAAAAPRPDVYERLPDEVWTRTPD